jgi:ribosome maturation protein SDO1
MSTKLTLARIKRSGQNFEISIDQDAALKYKQGNTPLRDVLQADNIFTDVKRGQVASNDELQRAFETTDIDKIADFILHKGEIQLSADHRSQERDEKRKKLIHMIHQHAIDPKTKLPHPVTRIELALEQGKISLSDNKSIEDQFDDIITKLRPIIPISIEKKQLTVKIPGTFAGKAQQFVRSLKLMQEDWGTDGSWVVKVEIPAGMIPDILEKLNSITHGEVQVSEK